MVSYMALFNINGEEFKYEGNEWEELLNNIIEDLNNKINNYYIQAADYDYVRNIIDEIELILKFGEAEYEGKYIEVRYNENP